MCADQAGMLWVGWMQKVDRTKSRDQAGEDRAPERQKGLGGGGLKGGRKGKQRRGSKAGTLTQRQEGRLGGRGGTGRREGKRASDSLASRCVSRSCSSGGSLHPSRCPSAGGVQVVVSTTRHFCPPKDKPLGFQGC